MDEERKRILRMLAEGKISTDECEELLDALADRSESRPPPPARRRLSTILITVLLILLAIPAFIALVIAVLSLIPYALAAIGVGLWIWMILDCLERPPRSFRLIFTRNPEHEKWIWVAVTVFGSWVGALVYFLLIRQPARSITPPKPLYGPPDDSTSPPDPADSD